MRVLLPDGAEANPRGDALKRAPTTDATTDAILEILKTYKTIAVVGLSSNPMRPSHGVTECMQGAGGRDSGDRGCLHFGGASEESWRAEAIGE